MDHDKLAREAGCLTCHVKVPGQGNSITASSSLKLRENAAQWCLTCHSMDANSHHPTDIVLNEKVNLPLEPGHKMTCLSCHNPHVARLATSSWVPDLVSKTENGKYKTFYLNMPNHKGELCQTCHIDKEYVFSAREAKRTIFENRGYAGSKSCKKCHLDIYRIWKKTPHAKMVREFKATNEIEKIPAEKLNWPIEKIKYTLGSHYVRRFVAKASGTLIVLPKIWDISKKHWLPVFDHGWKTRNWLKQCAGCHTTGFSVEDDSFIEAGIGCESCHGPALNHTRTGSKKYVINPARLTVKRKEMICMSCHTSGIDNTATYQFPVGYRPGSDLTKYYSGLTPKPGQSNKNFTGDESFTDRERQWQYLKDNQFLAQGLTCDYCQNFRNFKTKNNSKYMTKAEYCLTCHQDRKNHPPASPGANCSTCHMPTKNASGTLSIHDHKFTFQE